MRLIEYEIFPVTATFSFDPRRTALVTIDMQYFDAHPDYGFGAVAKEKGLEDVFAYRFRAIRQTIPNIRRLQEACRRAGIDVVHVKIENLAPDGRDGSLAHRLRGIAVPRDSKEAEILEELAPAPGEIVIGKTSSGAFNSTAIDQVLRNLGIETLIVTGIVTNGCVELTARDAADRGYWVLLVSDGCAANSEELHRNALARMNGGLMRVVSTDDALALIAGARPQEVTAAKQ